MDEIERRLGAEEPDMVSAFRRAPVAADPDRSVFVLLGALLACVGLYADLQLLVLLSMVGATVALVTPVPRPQPSQDGDDRDTGPGPVPMA